MLTFSIPGTLVSFRSGRADLDGFLCAGPRRRGRLLVFVHGMRSNFYRSRLKKELMRQARARRDAPDLFFFNNRGAEEAVTTERFRDCRADLDAALAAAREWGYRRFLLAGHSTGCQKIVWYQARRQRPDVEGLVLLAPCDDLAISRRDLGADYEGTVAFARKLVAEGRGGEWLADPRCLGFAARRFLSVADGAELEASLFDYAGPLRHFRRLRDPLLVVFGTREEYACRPLAEMGAILRARTAARDFTLQWIPRGDHGFHGVEALTARRLLDWAAGRRP